MTTFHTLLLAAHVFIGAMIIILVLLQRGKGAETGAAFGSGASATVFGAKGSANFLSRSTAVLATLFFASSLTLAYLGSQRPVAQSLVEKAEAAGTQGGGETRPGSSEGAPQTAPPPADAPAGGTPVPPTGP